MGCQGNRAICSYRACCCQSAIIVKRYAACSRTTGYAGYVQCAGIDSGVVGNNNVTARCVCGLQRTHGGLQGRTAAADAAGGSKGKTAALYGGSGSITVHNGSSGSLNINRTACNHRRSQGYVSGRRGYLNVPSVNRIKPSNGSWVSSPSNGSNGYSTAVCKGYCAAAGFNGQVAHLVRLVAKVDRSTGLHSQA